MKYTRARTANFAPNFKGIKAGLGKVGNVASGTINTALTLSSVPYLFSMIPGQGGAQNSANPEEENQEQPPQPVQQKKRMSTTQDSVRTVNPTPGVMAPPDFPPNSLRY